jgi:GST-like protein
LKGDQFGSGFVGVNPNSKIPALMDYSAKTPTRIFESGAILLYLAEKFNAFLPSDATARTECLSWLFWQMGSAPYLGGGFGHFYAYAPYKMEYPINRFTMETKRQLDVLDQRLGTCAVYCGGSDYTLLTWRSGHGTGNWYWAGNIMPEHFWMLIPIKMSKNGPN